MRIYVKSAAQLSCVSAEASGLWDVERSRQWSGNRADYLMDSFDLLGVCSRTYSLYQVINRKSRFVSSFNTATKPAKDSE